MNQDGYESSNGTICAGRDLPWLQEATGSTVWESWDVVYRDVIIVDSENVQIDVFNLSDNNLSEQENYDALKLLLLNAAE